MLWFTCLLIGGSVTGFRVCRNRAEGQTLCIADNLIPNIDCIRYLLHKNHFVISKLGVDRCPLVGVLPVICRYHEYLAHHRRYAHLVCLSPLGASSAAAPG